MGKVIEVVAAVIERDGNYLLTQRNATAVLPLLWEFPGGKVEQDESLEAALVREVAHRIGLTIVVGDRLAQNTHHYSDYEVRMTLYSCELSRYLEPLARGVQQVRWVASGDLGDYDFPPADQQSMSLLLDIQSDG